MKIAIVGSRKYENKRKIKEFIFKLRERFGDKLTIVSGGCRDGADRYAKKYALEFGVSYKEYPPAHHNYNLYCVLPESCYSKMYHPSNYHMRNKMIAKSSNCVVGFIPKGIESSGTESTLKYAKEFKKKIMVIT